MQSGMSRLGKSIARELAALAQHIVPPAHLGVQPESLHRMLHHAQLPRHIVAGFGHHKREIQVPQIMVHRPATGASPHQVAAVSLQPLHIALGKRVLVLPDHHRAPVLPQIEQRPSHIGLRKEIVLNSQIEIRVILIAYYYLRHNRLLYKFADPAPLAAHRLQRYAGASLRDAKIQLFFVLKAKDDGNKIGSLRQVVVIAGVTQLETFHS